MGLRGKLGENEFISFNEVVLGHTSRKTEESGEKAIEGRVATASDIFTYSSNGKLSILSTVLVLL